MRLGSVLAEQIESLEIVAVLSIDAVIEHPCYESHYPVQERAVCL